MSRDKFSILCALAASAMFAVNDALIKHLSDSYPLYEIVFIRSLVAILITAAVFVQLEGGWQVLRTKRPLVHLARGTCLLIANLTIFTALAVVPLAEAIAIFFVAPLLVTALATLFLGEISGVHRWVALCIGLAGVLLIVQPGGLGFHWALILPFISAVAYAAVHTITRSMGLRESATAMSFYAHVVFLVAGAAAGLTFGDGKFGGHDNASLEFVFRAWKLVPILDLMFMVGGGFCIAFAGYLITQAYRLSSAGLIAPFEYSALIYSTILGYVFWDEVPSTLSGIGMVLIVFTGIYVALNGTKLGARRIIHWLLGRR